MVPLPTSDLVEYTQFLFLVRNRLEMLNMSQNRLDNIEGLASLQALVALNIGACLFFKINIGGDDNHL